MKQKWMGLVLALCAFGLAQAPRAEARDFNIAGGIQYVVQGIKAKDQAAQSQVPDQRQGYLEDAHRLFGKAVVALNKGIANDPKDDEAWDYLGRAYGELDSAEQSGKAYAEAMRRFQSNPKMLKRSTDNRDYFFADYYNKGLNKYKEATTIMPVEEIPGSTDAKATEAKAKIAEAETYFRNALLINNEKAIAYDNLAIMQSLQGKSAEAAATIDAGLANSMPKEGDEYARLTKRKDSMFHNAVAKDLEKGDFDAGIAKLEAILAKTGDDFGVLTEAAQTSFKKAEKQNADKDEAGAKASFTKAAGYFERASAVAPDAQNKNDMLYNAAIASQQGGDYKAAATSAFKLLQENPKSLDYHRLLRNAYDKMGNEKKRDEQTWIILGLAETATVVTDIPLFTAKMTKTSEAGKALEAYGAPEEIRQFQNGDIKVDVWYWWSKKRAIAFTSGRQLVEANFGELVTDVPAAPAKQAAKTGAAKKG